MLDSVEGVRGSDITYLEVQGTIGKFLATYEAYMYTLKTNMEPQGIIFRFHVSFREGYILVNFLEVV